MSSTLKKSSIFVLILMLCVLLMGVFATDNAEAATKTHLKKTTITMDAGDTYQQKLILPDGRVVSTSKVKWKSCYTKVATISSKGVVKEKYHGTAKLKASYKGKTYTFRVKVKDYNFLSSQYHIETGKSKVVHLCKYVPEEKIPAEHVDFWSEDENVATVSETGKVVGITSGETKVWAEYKGRQYSCDIYVSDPPRSKVTCVTSLPHISNYYSVNFQVTSFTCKLRNDKNLINLNIEGVCTEILDNKEEGYAEVKCRLYDSDGFLIKTENILIGKVKRGDKVRKSWGIGLIGDERNAEYYEIELS